MEKDAAGCRVYHLSYIVGGIYYENQNLAKQGQDQGFSSAEIPQLKVDSTAASRVPTFLLQFLFALLLSALFLLQRPIDLF